MSACTRPTPGPIAAVRGTGLPLLVVALFVLTVPAGLHAQSDASAGPVVKAGGAVFPVTPDFATPLDIDYRIAFEVAQGGDTERVSTSLNTVARYLNMHARAGVSGDRLGAAVVVHGTAVMDVLSPEAYRARSGGANPNQVLLQELLDAGTRVIVCGQSVASRGFAPSELADGVELALSAMTAFVALQREGYLVNPW
jgi:intracellular sulfur oxidation DsrE/DsrF family protein